MLAGISRTLSSTAFKLDGEWKYFSAELKLKNSSAKVYYPGLTKVFVEVEFFSNETALFSCRLSPKLHGVLKGPEK